MDNSPAKNSKMILIGTSLRDLPVQRHFAALSRELINSGYPVTLLVHGPVEPTLQLDPRIDVLHWPSPRPTRLTDIVFFDRLVRRLRPCCLASNFGARAIMMTIGGLRRVPVRIHWHHTLASQIATDCGHSPLRLRLLQWRSRIPFSLVTHVIANSHAAKLDVINTFGVPAQKCQVFWNSLEDPQATTNMNPPPAAKPGNSRCFVCVGRFTASKGQAVLLKAAAQVITRHPELTIEFIGDGATRVSCEKLARQSGLAQQCRFHGTLPHAAVLAKMAAAWAVVVPSQTEAFGLVNIESMAVGVPVLGANTGGIPEIIRNGVDGFLFPPADHDSLARHMMALLENEPRRAEMGANARRRFAEQFESTRAVQQQVRWILEQVTKVGAGSSCPATASYVPEPLLNRTVI